MSEDMVERAVEAMFRCLFAKEESPEVIAQKWEEWPEYRAHVRKQARAAIEAMREPTEAMMRTAAETPGMKAANSAMTLHQARGYGFDKGAFDDGSPLEQAWRAAIDTALSENTDA